MPDALCAATAHRLGIPLLTADLLPTEEDTAVVVPEEHDIDGADRTQDVTPGPATDPLPAEHR
ncbi:hypothetical protein [Kitasatospora sp. NPDC092286]|uniref:hypothetical protein n=1 Tax=Kitasatospora sp. NPDC092286 TaxID=3364087 RepID=UPI0037F56928